MPGRLLRAGLRVGGPGIGSRRPARRGVRLAATLCALLGVLLCCAAGAGAYNATLTRTTGGVANIESSSLAGAGFGTGYAQAQDGICTLADVYLTVSGERASFFGPSATVKDEDTKSVDTDLSSDLYWTSLIDNHTVESLLALPFPKGPSQAAKEVVAGFAAGYDKYLSDIGGPAGITDPRCAGAAWVRPIKAIDVWRRMYQLDTLAGGAARASLIAPAAPPAGQPNAKRAAIIKDAEPAGEDIGNALVDSSTVSGSNGMGIGGEDATSGGGVTLANPHFPWLGDERFWESHVDVPGTYEMIGASLWGVPLVTIGHNQHVSWTHTVSTNVTTSSFKLTLVPGHDTEYLVDGAATPMTHTDVTVQALEGGVLVPHSHRFYYSKYGPIVASPGWTTTSATAFDDANFTNLRGADQWLKMGESSSAAELLASQKEIDGVPWVNTIGADDKGNAFYSEIVVTPDEPISYLNGACNLSPSHSTAGPFDGSKSECELPSDPDSVSPGVFGASSAPQLVRKDYTENSNNSFWLANANQLLTGFSPAFGNEVANPGMRSQTGIDMVNQRVGTFNSGVPTDGLGATPGFTAQNLQESWASFRAMPAERALPGLREICHNAVANSGGVINKVNVSAACPVLDAYDATAKLNSPGGWLFNRWWASAPTTVSNFWVHPWSSSEPVYTPNTLNTTLSTSQNALAAAVSDLEARGIPLNASFGQVQYTQRATKIPIPGCGDGSNCFAVINSSYDSSTAKTSAVNGSSSSIVMFTELNPTTGPLSKGLLTYSQSEDISSPFYEDQTRRFSNNEWITLPWTTADVSAQQISAPQSLLSTQPTVTHVAPESGPQAGGTTVTIAGTLFGEASAVKFGSTPASEFTVNSGTSITAVAPAGTGTVDVSVTTPAGTSAANPSDEFTYLVPPPVPVVKKVTPHIGSTAGGTTVTITGSKFTAASAVHFGSTPAASFTVSSDGSITAVSPEGEPGIVDVTVSSEGGTSTILGRDHFKYEKPTITGVSPNSGSVAGGTAVTITGTGFAPGAATTIKFDNKEASSVNCSSSTTCTAVSPAHKAVGTVDVHAVVNGKHSSANSPADEFSYTKP
ncbi:MAG TPA: penicillin acylase family protein [Solirubrobacteraceae bacterium]